MALFLNESLTDLDTETISIEEAYDGLLEASYEMHELTESILQADFIIHEECKSLNEAERDNKEVNFLVKSARAIKEFIIKVVERIKTFFVSLGNNMKLFWSKLLAKFGDRDVLAPQGMSAMADVITSELSISEKLAASKDVATATLDAQAAKVKDLLGKFSIITKEKNGKTEKTKLSKFTKVLAVFSAATLVSSVVTLKTVINANDQEMQAFFNKIKGIDREKEPHRFKDAMDLGLPLLRRAEKLRANGAYGLKVTNNIGLFATMLKGGLANLISVGGFSKYVKDTSRERIIDINATNI